MTIAQVVDLGLLVVAAVGPVLCVLRWERWGVALGAAFAWLVLLVAGEVLSALDPSRDTGMLDSLWFLFGWILTLAYTAVVGGAIRVVAARWSRRPR